MKRLLGYCNRKNIGTWGPMLLSIVIMFASPVVNMLFLNNSPYFWLTAVFSIVFSLLFIVLSAKYVSRWHSIYSVLSTNGELKNTCAFLAAMQRTKSVNQRMVVSKIDVEYIFDNKLDSDPNTYFPFKVKYHVYARVNNKNGISNIYFHLISGSNKKVSKQIKYKFCNDGSDEEHTPKVDREDINIQVIKLAAAKIFEINDEIEYYLEISFDDTQGISTSGVQRLLFYPYNFSPNFIENADANISFQFKNEVYSALKDTFQEIVVHTYINGLEEDRATEDKALISVNSEAGDIVMLHTTVALNADNLYAIKFVPIKPENQ